ncbi:hypothetical protein PsorP6_014343 [Peronosclerospora sorghi]|uniref:Uncharacterized protein n=1 Tax=Peronosclerospora sorghi TaxID=230839 RepID=A0ACC0VJ77_9STRA|nr:hypothetical protein PsorP6_014343 [Peronosclerospora sorghi]
MVAQLLRHGPRRFATALFSDASNPEVVWNANMRNQMVTYIEKFMDLHTDEHGMFYLYEKEGSEHKACIALIGYPKEVHALQCYQYYLHNLMDERNFPGWPIIDEAAFLRQLLAVVGTAIRTLDREARGSGEDNARCLGNVTYYPDVFAALFRLCAAGVAIVTSMPSLIPGDLQVLVSQVHKAAQEVHDISSNDGVTHPLLLLALKMLANKDHLKSSWSFDY